MSVDATPYANLSPDLVLDAIAAAGFVPDGRLLALGSYENRVYQVGIDDGPTLVAKFYRPQRWSDAAIAEEHAFARELDEAELPIVAPIDVSGRTLLTHAGFRYALPASRTLTTRDVIADNGAAASYVEGDAITDWRSRAIDFETLPIEARIDEGEPIPRLAGLYYRDPVDVLVDMVNALSARGIGLASGDVMSTGSLTVATAIGAGQTFVARFGDFSTLRVTLV